MWSSVLEPSRGNEDKMSEKISVRKKYPLLLPRDHSEDEESEGRVCVMDMCMIHALQCCRRCREVAWNCARFPKKQEKESHAHLFLRGNRHDECDWVCSAPAL